MDYTQREYLRIGEINEVLLQQTETSKYSEKVEIVIGRKGQLNEAFSLIKLLPGLYGIEITSFPPSVAYIDGLPSSLVNTLRELERGLGETITTIDEYVRNVKESIKKFKDSQVDINNLELVKDIRRENSIFALAYVRRKDIIVPIGYGLSYEIGNVTYHASFAVYTSYRRRGIGRKIVETIRKETTPSLEILTTWLSTNPAMISIFGEPYKFWWNLGFKIISPNKLTVEFIRRIHESLGIVGRIYLSEDIGIVRGSEYPIIGYYENGWPMLLMKRKLKDEIYNSFTS